MLCRKTALLFTAAFWSTEDEKSITYATYVKAWKITMWIWQNYTIAKPQS